MNAVVAALKAAKRHADPFFMAEEVEPILTAAGLRIVPSGLLVENEKLRAAILDIDAHARSMAEDDDGFVTGGYLVTVGALHRALGVIGHTAPLCKNCPHPHDVGEEGQAVVDGQVWRLVPGPGRVYRLRPLTDEAPTP